jgi:light-regulated signal transduction histidine kinase (bacteriophytochrome)
MTHEAQAPQQESLQLEGLQRENLLLRAELAQSKAALQEFTSSVSHDLRASLRHVTAFVKIIKEDLGDQIPAPLPVLAHLDTVAHAAGQMGLQIDGLMELSRLTRVDLALAPLVLGALLDDVSAALAGRLAGRAVQWQLAPDIPALQADAVLVRQLLQHLLGNALKFSAARELTQIQVNWVPHANGQCAVTVKDNGAGFNPQYVDKLFHAFQRLHSAKEFPGIGMGLALSRKIVERHGGVIWAEGARDGGCSVSFTLPLAL